MTDHLGIGKSAEALGNVLYASGFMGFQSSQTPLSKKTANLITLSTVLHDTAHTGCQVYQPHNPDLMS